MSAEIWCGTTGRSAQRSQRVAAKPPASKVSAAKVHQVDGRPEGTGVAGSSVVDVIVTVKQHVPTPYVPEAWKQLVVVPMGKLAPEGSPVDWNGRVMHPGNATGVA